MDDTSTSIAGTAYAVSLIYVSLWLGLGEGLLFAFLCLGSGYLANLLMNDFVTIGSTKYSLAIVPAIASLGTGIISTIILAKALL